MDSQTVSIPNPYDNCVDLFARIVTREGSSSSTSPTPRTSSTNGPSRSPTRTTTRRPIRGSRCLIDLHTIRKETNEVVSEESFEGKEIILGDLDVMPGVETALSIMSIGEEDIVELRGSFAYGHRGSSSRSTYQCRISLIAINEPYSDLRNIPTTQRVNIGIEKMSRAGVWSREAHVANALSCYGKALKYLKRFDGGDVDRNAIADESDEMLSETRKQCLRSFVGIVESGLCIEESPIINGDLDDAQRSLHDMKTEILLQMNRKKDAVDHLLKLRRSIKNIDYQEILTVAISEIDATAVTGNSGGIEITEGGGGGGGSSGGNNRNNFNPADYDLESNDSMHANSSDSNGSDDSSTD